MIRLDKTVFKRHQEDLFIDYNMNIRRIEIKFASQYINMALLVSLLVKDTNH